MGDGFVSLVGAGPGDPELLTLKALDRIRGADLVVHDHLVSPAILAEIPMACERVYVGKWAGERVMSQEAIEALLIVEARSGRRVVRLKGGDPFVFGRGGEEALALQAAGIPWEVVPGISSALGVPAAAGIPVTHRGIASSVLVMTGHADPVSGEGRARLERAAGNADTLVILMATRHLAAVAAVLQESGLAGKTPAAVISWGTRARESAVEATLATLESALESTPIAPPSVLVVGDAAAHHSRLRPLVESPLLGVRVVVTRERQQGATIVRSLRAHGAEAWCVPMLRFGPPPDRQALEEALTRIGEWDWVVFTSANAVVHFLDALVESGRDVRALSGARIASVGPATSAALKARGIRCDCEAIEHRAEGLVEAMRAEGDLQGLRILQPRALEGRELLATSLRQSGAEVHVAPVYQTFPPSPEDAQGLRSALSRGELDVLTLTSGSTVSHVAAALGEEAKSLLEPVTLAAISPLTAERAAEQGWDVPIIASTHSMAGLVEAILEWASPEAS
jgi:uroporphyrinogen III methyltransferase/synthase